ncbi:MAG: hypothetical protein JXA19_02385 [Anaerolineales bacterium]|nr:hypothetical protein [Anaerolineales bacterium]
MTENNHFIRNLRVFLGISLILAAGAILHFIQQAIDENVLFVTLSRSVMIVFGTILTVLLLILFILSLTKKSSILHSMSFQINTLIHKIPKWILWVSMAGMIGIYLYLVYGYYGRYFLDIIPRYFLFWSISSGIALLTGRLLGWVSPGKSFAFSFLALGVSHHLMGYAAELSTYPFSIGWSEGSRYYYASTFFAEKFYGFKFALPHNNVSRYLLQAIPFLIPGLPLWVHRLWQVILYIAFTFLTGWISARKKKDGDLPRTFMITAWASLFIFQGPIYYQMLSIVVLVLWIADIHKFWRTTFLILFVSAWAGITRINWVPMPALIVTIIYLLQMPFSQKNIKGFVTYFGKSIFWGLSGSLTGWVVSNLYTTISGHSGEETGAFWSSALLWDRLFPNISYKLGILTGSLLISLPLLIYIFLYWNSNRGKWSFWRTFSLLGILGILFVGGLVVSVKIGGGTNLHNMDAYMIILLLLGCFTFLGLPVDSEGRAVSYSPPPLLLAAVLLIPVLFIVSAGKPLTNWNRDQTKEELNILQEMINDALEQHPDKKVLFISQRHLIPFGLIDGGELEPDYEKMFLMEMVMAENEHYLVQFYDDLENHDFSLIITDPIYTRIKEYGKESLVEENNLYVQMVSRPVLCFYEQKKTFSDIPLQVLAPLEKSKCE